MLRVTTICLIVCFTIETGVSVKLPPYLVACSRNDPALNECAAKNGKNAISHIVQGDTEYQIPVLEPLILSSVSVNGGSGRAGSSITFTDMHINGLSNATIEEVRIDLGRQHIDWFMTVPRIVMLCGYTVKGRLLIIPITGNGAGNITLTKVSLVYSFDFKLEKRSDDEYMHLLDSGLKFDTQRAYITLDNLFNGDSFLGSSINRFLDENWREVVKDVGPPIADGIGLAIKQMISNITTRVPYKYIFPEQLD